MTITAIQHFIEEQEILENAGIILFRFNHRIMGKYMAVAQTLADVAGLETIVHIKPHADTALTMQKDEFLYCIRIAK